MEQEWYLFCILMYWTRDCSMAISWYVFVQWLHKGFLYFHFPGPRGIFWVPSWAVLISRDVEEAGESVSMSMHCPLTVIPLHTSLQSMRAQISAGRWTVTMSPKENRRFPQSDVVQMLGVLKEQVAWPRHLREPPRPWLVNGSVMCSSLTSECLQFVYIHHCS